MKYRYYLTLFDGYRSTPRYRYFKIGVHKRYWRWKELMVKSKEWVTTDWYLGGAQHDKRFLGIKEVTKEELDNFLFMQELVG